MKHLKVVAGIIVCNGKILCLQRNAGKHDYVSYKFEFPGGKIENGETKEEALERELMEELELPVKVLSHYCTVNHKYPDFEITMDAFCCTTDNMQFKLKEHKSFEWLSPLEMQGLDWAAADRPIVEKIINKGLNCE